MTQPVEQRAAPEAGARSSATQRVPRANIVKIVAASLVTMVVVGWNLGLLSDDSESAPRSAVPIAAVGPPAPAPAPRSTPAGVPARTERGFANPGAQCNQPQRALAIGRTQDSLVVICAGPDGLQYRGVRLSLRAGTRVDDVTAAAGTYTARNETATYTVTPTQLVVSVAGGRVNREPMLEYVAPEQVMPRVPTPAPALAQPPSVKPNPPAPSRPSARPLPGPRPAPSPAAQRETSPQDDTSARRGGMGTGNVRFVATAPWRLHYSVQCPTGTPVGGSITGSGSGGTAFYVLLRGNTGTPAQARGRSLRKTLTGPIVVGVRPANENCRWTVAFD